MLVFSTGRATADNERPPLKAADVISGVISGAILAMVGIRTNWALPPVVLVNSLLTFALAWHRRRSLLRAVGAGALTAALTATALLLFRALPF